LINIIIPPVNTFFILKPIEMYRIGHMYVIQEYYLNPRGRRLCERKQGYPEKTHLVKQLTIWPNSTNDSGDWTRITLV